MTSYYRIQTADRDAADLVDDQRQQISCTWVSQAEARPGVSVCSTLGDLATYLAQSGIPFGSGEWVIVELDGDRVLDATPFDAEYGELLVWPTEILSVRPLDAEFYDLINTAYDALED